MSRPNVFSPSLVPVLARGRHRSARSGACFMEFASFLAGERWTDHPDCTDGTLAQLARGVNDSVSDETRSKLVHLIPTVVGMRGDDRTTALVVAIVAACAALPVANESRQHALAAGLLQAQEMLPTLGPDLSGRLDGQIRKSLGEAPGSERWARRFRRTAPLRYRADDVVAASRTMVATAVAGIAEACIADPDDLLVLTLVDAIETCALHLNRAESLQQKAPERVLV